MRDFTQNVGNVFTTQHQTCVDEIFKCTIFVGVRRADSFTGAPPDAVNAEIEHLLKESNM